MQGPGQAATPAGRPLALLTGASSGIGLELARQFAHHGFDLIVNAEDELAAATASLADGDTDVQAVKADPVIDVNVTAVVHLAKRLLPGMVERGAGRVLITSSVAATMPGPYYAASKAFLQSFAQAVRHELKDSGVTVTALQPGPTDTEFFERAGMDDTKVADARKDDPAEVAKDGFEALMAGRDHVIAGSAKNKAQVAASKLLPEKARAALHAVQTKPDGGQEDPASSGVDHPEG